MFVHSSVFLFFLIVLAIQAVLHKTIFGGSLSNSFEQETKMTKSNATFDMAEKKFVRQHKSSLKESRKKYNK